LTDQITICGARTHNLKNIDVDIPYGQLTVVSGLWFRQILSRL
jgi:excinuclease UvrABC ATPase subunit